MDTIEIIKIAGMALVIFSLFLTIRAFIRAYDNYKIEVYKRERFEEKRADFYSRRGKHKG